MQRWLTFLIGLLIFLQGTFQAEATGPVDLLEAARRLDLGNHPVWLKLLHYERDGNHSEILTDAFFLSRTGRENPEAELAATIEAYWDPWAPDNDSHARCQYPARYFWLAQHLPLPEYRIREPRCGRLEKWALLDRVQSISLFLVSGYFGNPASTFGHALLKLNTDSTDAESGLFDLVLNYGAVVPENEATSTYVFRGLSGGYEAGFSDKYFYTQDLVYTRTEFRDIWDYKLNLSAEQRIFLVFHIWEIIGKKFTYYFLDKNCAYRLAELIELVTEEDLLDYAHVWYIPVELFHRLKAIDNLRREYGDPGLIQSVSFIPSSQRTLYHQLARLVPQEIKAANTIIKEGHAVMAGQLKSFIPERQIEILDAILAYHQYRLVAEEPTPEIERRKAKDQILLERLRLPARRVPLPEVPALDSPAQGSRPMAIGLGVARDWDGASYWRAQWAPFSKELVGLNSLEGSELAVLDLIVGLKDEGNSFIDQVDLVRVRKLNTAPVAIAGERQWAWQVRAGARRMEDDEEARHDIFLRLGAGVSRQWKNMLVMYAMTDVAAHRLSPHARLRPLIGLSARIGALGAWGYVGGETTRSGAEFRDVWGGKIQYHLSPHRAVRVEVSNENNARASASLISYW